VHQHVAFPQENPKFSREAHSPLQAQPHSASPVTFLRKRNPGCRNPRPTAWLFIYADWSCVNCFLQR